MVGAGGRFFGIITYGAQMRFVGENFIPDYFDSTYDLYRVQKYSIYTGQNYVDGSLSPVNMPAYTGWLGSVGLSILDDKLSFIASMDGAFNADLSNLGCCDLCLSSSAGGSNDGSGNNPRVRRFGHLRQVFNR